MPNIPDHNSPGIKESTIKVFKQKYYVVDDVEETGYRTDYELREERIEILTDEDGVFIESKDGGATEALSIATPEMAIKVAQHILSEYDDKVETNSSEEEIREDLLTVEQIKFLTPEVQDRVAHELWRLKNHCTSPHGPVDATGAYELLNHLKAISDYLDIKPAPLPAP